MTIEKRLIRDSKVLPVIAALPYLITALREETESVYSYDPSTQLTMFAGGRNYSTCRYDESVNPIFGKSRSDTQKDD